NGDFSGSPTYEKNERPHVTRQPAIYPLGPAKTIRWTGYYIPKNSGVHRWFARASGTDSYTLWVNGEKALEQPKREGQVPKSLDMQMEAGKPYEVRFDYRQQPSWLGSGVLLGVLAKDRCVRGEGIAMAKAPDVAVVFVGYDEHSESEAADR